MTNQKSTSMVALYRVLSTFVLTPYAVSVHCTVACDNPVECSTQGARQAALVSAPIREIQTHGNGSTQAWVSVN